MINLCDQGAQAARQLGRKLRLERSKDCFITASRLRGANGEIGYQTRQSLVLVPW